MNKKLCGEIFYDGKIYTNSYLLKSVITIKSFLNNINWNNRVVVLFLKRDINMLLLLMSLYELKITFVPIDIETPSERLHQMLNIIDFDFIITNESYKSCFEFHSTLYLENIVSSKVKCEKKRICKLGTNEVMYIIFTSGTSGVPKAVQVTRVGFENFLLAIPKAISLCACSTCACISSYAFDIFYLESILALYEGKRVVLASEKERNNPRLLIKLLTLQGVDMLQITPSRLKQLYILDNSFRFLDHIKVLMVGGEKFPEEYLHKLQEKKEIHIYNMYGPTETTIWSMVSNLTGKKSATLGKAIKNTRIYLLDNENHEVKEKEVGEICIAGRGVAKGYLNDLKQTAERFVSLDEYGEERVYKTGDLGIRNQQGEIMFIGRNDEQIKRNGYRIELSDIDNNLCAIEGISGAVTCYSSEKSSLIAFIKSMGNVNEKDIRKIMKKMLPSYMLPQKYIFVKEFMYTISGKIDKKRMLKELNNNE